MKTIRFILSCSLGAVGCAGISVASAQTRSAEQPTVITPPAVNNGSNWSRAPFPAARQHDDMKAPDGVAIDESLPPNSPATNIEPPPPPPVVAIFQPDPSPALTGDPGLLPTGRPSIQVATTIDAATFAPTIRSTAHVSRDQLIDQIENRLQASESAMTTFRGSMSQMSAEGRRTFNEAADDVNAAAKALRKSIRAAEKASAAEWENARAQLAADYEAYGAALARIDAAAGVTVQR